MTSGRWGTRPSHGAQSTKFQGCQRQSAQALRLRRLAELRAAPESIVAATRASNDGPT
eukprot:CAMPEP_0172726768 /NCGR_PEP_ID=MMETSP1074-20121228/91303_1 /TAXON_ID=2916 /ORGANISM="Ceratium fusus, Strain PA161109" /LENGTH=57 /DNA_ID=CAMNT_0013553857 /DNA_START=107 /DNA_END=277 /DNA_ORIENTATION=+